MVLRCQDVKGILMGYILANLWIAKDMEMVNGCGIMDKYMKVNGGLELKMDMVFGNLQKVILMRVIGS